MLVLLHTSAVHVPVFDALRDRDHPSLSLRHLVHDELLARAVRDGPEAVAPAVEDVLAGAVADGASAVLCTCSTIGGVAEACGPRLGVPVLRVDRPMAAAAARHRRVLVVAALHSTLEPTAALIREEAAGRDVELTTRLVDGAWERFQAGDRDGYLDAVAAAVEDVGGSDVVVLAQASMADAADRADSRVPVLSSPRPGLRAAAAAAAGT
ncbi:aspartate/glutamate racemase family protein [Streptomyces peucetius]|uniref:Aspartate/glutamate racemase family protein n=1 Tax=Streptomyces peucetius TaxID=1950 RepID=A0ABY6IJJ9_STRPE|nr:aspartate/glutamate racemase family protein [Streptomyces peucetius]UYQ65890.1 aspartate/glutamate racemase family protein [Streptomyces peucetius]